MSVSASETTSRLGTVRRLPVPLSEPPYDDELGPLRPASFRTSSNSSAVQETLALSFVLPSGLPAVPEPPVLRLAPPLDDDDFAPRPTPRSELPDPRRWAAQLVQALVEVVSGDRPATQLVRWTTSDVYSEIRAAAQAFWLGASASAGKPVRLGPQTARILVRSVRVCEPADGAAEVCATVQRGPRSAAIALRLDGVDGRWQCSALQLG